MKNSRSQLAKHSLGFILLVKNVFPRLVEVEELGQSLLQGSSNGKAGGVDIQKMLGNLSADWAQLDRLWSSRTRHLEQEVNLQRLNQEGDRIEAALSGHEARLRVQDVGVRTYSDFRAS